MRDQTHGDVKPILWPPAPIASPSKVIRYRNKVTLAPKNRDIDSIRFSLKNCDFDLDNCHITNKHTCTQTDMRNNKLTTTANSNGAFCLTQFLVQVYSRPGSVVEICMGKMPQCSHEHSWENHGYGNYLCGLMVNCRSWTSTARNQRDGVTAALVRMPP